MSRRFATSLLAGAALLLPAAAMANPDVLRLTKDPNNWAIWGGNYAGRALQRAQPDQRDQRRQAASRVDLLDRRAARSRRWPDGDR